MVVTGEVKIMKENSIHAVAKQLNISKDTLRYYDRIGLVSPTRGENNYRYYQDTDIIALAYIQVMKYAGFQLEEIKALMSYYGTVTKDCNGEVANLLITKKASTVKKIAHLQEIVKLLDQSIEIAEGCAVDDTHAFDGRVIEIFESIQTKK